MRTLLLPLFLLIGIIALPAQNPVDTPGLTGTIADTAVASQLLKESDELRNQFKYDLAIVKAKKVIEIGAQHLGTEAMLIANAYIAIGRAYQQKGKQTDAIENYTLALQIKKKLLGEDDFELAYIYTNLGNSYTSLDIPKAIEHFNKVIALVLKHKGPESVLFASPYNGLGLCYSVLGDFSQSLEYYKKSLNVLLKNVESTHVNVGHCYQNIGNIHSNQGRFNESLIYFEKALEVFIKALGGNHPTTSRVYINIGLIYSAKGDTDKALYYFEKALACQVIALGAEHYLVGNSYHNIGLAHQQKGNIEAAISNYQKALTIKIKTFGEKAWELGTTYNNLGECYQVQQNFDEAILYHEKAIQCRMQFSKNFLDLQSSYANIGGCFFQKGVFDQAVNYLQKSIQLMIDNQKETNPKLALSYVALGNIFATKNDFETALKYYDLSFSVLNFNNESYTKVSSFSLLSKTLQVKGRLLEQLYSKDGDVQKLQEAFMLFSNALKAIGYQYKDLSSTEVQSQLYSDSYPIFEDAIRTALKLSEVTGDPSRLTEAFHIAGRSKSIVLQQAIREADALQFSGIPDTLLEQERTLRIDLASYEKRRQENLEKGAGETDTLVLSLNSHIFDTQQAYDALKNKLELEYPDYFRLKYDFSTLSVKEVQQQLLQPNQSLLQYFVGDSSIFVFVVRQDTFAALEIKRDFPLSDWVSQLRQGLYGYHLTPLAQRDPNLYGTTIQQYSKYAHLLYNQLVAPINALLTKDVIIIPDGVLNYIPFEALLTALPERADRFKSHAYLLNKHQISYSYSPTLLQEMRDRQFRQQPTNTCLVFAPYYDGDTTLLAKLFDYTNSVRKNLDPLPYSGEEAYQVKRLMGGALMLGQDATKDRFVQMASGYRLLHLVTHGQANDKVGNYSFLAFSSMTDSLDNELLYVRDIYNISLNADMVVLSACETGLGKLQRGEGIVSLARAFSYAGAKSLVTSLWAVNDAETKELMNQFYQNIKKGELKDKSLQEAKIHLVQKAKDSAEAHPFYWSGFITIGDMRAIK